MKKQTPGPRTPDSEIDWAIQIDRTVQEYGNALGKALKQRFEALEAIVAILAHNAPPDVQRRISEERRKRKATWLQ